MLSSFTPHVLLKEVRRARHVLEIQVRNLDQEVPVDCYYTLSSENNPENPFYVSAVARSTLNPVWNPIKNTVFTRDPTLAIQTRIIFRVLKLQLPPLPIHAMQKIPVGTPSSTSCSPVVALPSCTHDFDLSCLRDEYPAVSSQPVSPTSSLKPAPVSPNIDLKSKASGQLIFERVIDVGELELVQASDDLTQLVFTAPNFVVVTMPDGIYSPASVDSNQKKKTSVFRLGSKKVGSMVKPQSYESDLGGVAKSLKEISAEDVLQTAIKFTDQRLKIHMKKSQLKELREKLAKRTREVSFEVDWARKSKSLSQRVARLRRLMEMKAHNIERLRNKNKESARQLTQRAESIRKNLQALLEQKVELARQCKSESSQKSELHRLECELGLRKRSMLNVLLKIIPVTKSHQGFQVAGISLPSVFKDTRDKEDEISAATGYTAHIVSILSKYLEIPLRFSINLKGSRSDIKDTSRGYSSTDQVGHQLYIAKRASAQEVEMFKNAFALLNRNVIHMLNEIEQKQNLQENPRSSQMPLTSNYKNPLEGILSLKEKY